ncbi:potassium voltage-gated channel protein Shaw-like [Mizuhopecten yessoensis]|uniref:Potassium voltage-gated channel subfamily D member 1 n=1 Tax=Mizuhopecten yessoensis TaxID=6573 RepID=A0A210Q1R9_MIZYE|nr:potassium voltage-gated channel protein Shaw-like [Mizuhopecten yessoensis]OWF42693.1 Potassium voltage-gated channel subfamily D member 1 [Mizuhopecten yessoensis]
MEVELVEESLCDKMDEIIHINLRGTRFSTVRSTLSRLPVAITEDKRGTYDVQNKEYFFNRNPRIFHEILDYCETGRLHLPENVCSQSSREELSFWGVPQDCIQQCCWKAFYKVDDEMDVLDKLLDYLPLDTDFTRAQSGVQSSGCGNFQGKLWRFIQGWSSSLAAKVWKVVIVVTVLVSLLVFLLESEIDFRDVFPLTTVLINTTGTDQDSTTVVPKTITGHRPKAWLALTNAVTNLILTLELALRIVSCPKKKHFFVSFLNISEILACIGVWIALYLDNFTVTFDDTGKRKPSYIFVFLLCLFRVFRIFRFFVNNSGMRILMLSLRSSSRELCLLFVSFVSFAVMFATVMFVCEYNVKTFRNIFVAIWWAFITMTTVGYGDYAPSTPLGFFFGGVCAVFGIMLIALPVAVTSSNFNDFFNYNRYRSRHHDHVKKSRDRRCAGPLPGVQEGIRSNSVTKTLDDQAVISAWNCGDLKPSKTRVIPFDTKCQ